MSIYDHQQRVSIIKTIFLILEHVHEAQDVLHICICLQIHNTNSVILVILWSLMGGSLCCWNCATQHSERESSFVFYSSIPDITTGIDISTGILAVPKIFSGYRDSSQKTMTVLVDLGCLVTLHLLHEILKYLGHYKIHGKKD